MSTFKKVAKILITILVVAGVIATVIAKLSGQ